MSQFALAPGTIISNRNRLWRVDAHTGNLLVATSIDGGETEQQKFYVPFEDAYHGPSHSSIGSP